LFPQRPTTAITSRKCVGGGGFTFNPTWQSHHPNRLAGEEFGSTLSLQSPSQLTESLARRELYMGTHSIKMDQKMQLFTSNFSTSAEIFVP